MSALVGSIALLGFALTGCGQDDADTASTTARSDPDSSSSSIETTESTAGSASTSPPAIPGSIVWPATGTAASADPKAVATEFATAFVGFVDPVVGEAAVATGGTATVEVRPRLNGPVTTVHLVQRGADTQWFVVGATTPNIVADPSLSGSTIASPVTLRGSSTAFEGTVDAAIRGRGTVEPLGSGFVTGGTYGELGPFEGSIAFSRGSVTEGVVVFSTRNMEDGSLWEATVVPVVLG